MGALGFFLAVVACAIIVKLSNWWDNRKEEKERQRIITMNQDAAARQIMNDTFERSKNVMEQTKGTRDLFLETLSKIGCQYELVDTLSRVKRTINETNCWHNMNIVYSINEAGNTFHVHTKKHFLFVSQIPDIEIYLQTVLGMFYEVRRYYETELDKLKCEEEKVSL